MFRRKHWIEVGRIFTPPVNKSFKVDRVSEEMLQKTLIGFTSIELREERTGEIKFVEQYGDQT